jgi:hypothetical protein
MWRTLCLLVCSLPGVLLHAQPDTTSADPLPQLNEQRLEDLLQDADEESAFDFNTAFEDLQIYLENPLDLNRASEEDLRELNLLSDVQITNLLNYRAEMDGFLTLYELQAVPGMDLASIRRFIPFVSPAQ